MECFHKAEKLKRASPTSIFEDIYDKVSRGGINFFDEFHSDLTACLSNCSNHGVCEIDRSSLPVLRLSCSCDPDYYGEACELDRQICRSSIPCRNGAKCEEAPHLPIGFRCECDASLYQGDLCEQRIDLCSNETCSDHGLCRVSNDRAHCVCFPSYRGLQCQEETVERSIVRVVIRTTSIIAIIVIVLFYLIFLLNDILSYCFNCNIAKKRTRQKDKIEKLFYVN